MSFENHLTTLAHDSIIEGVNHLIAHAYQQFASDIHIEPCKTNYRIRYRQNGLLSSVVEISHYLATRMITRLKVMAQLDISEKRLPQDGHFQLNTPHGENIEVRVNICPLLRGEKIVLRLLSNAQLVLSLDHLGFLDEQKKIFLEKISRPQGLILITGPTGSGKTSTLYAALQYLSQLQKNIITVEDPIEIQLENINQLQLNPKIGLNFAMALRALLRQDPDIIMIGEMRDQETAEIAIQAAQTGHLVLSTLHSNNTLETLTRLRLLGCKPYHLTSALSLIIAQRLVKREGFNGRTAIFECLPLTESLATEMIHTTDQQKLIKIARAQGFITLYEVGMQKVLAQEISMAELLRVV